MSFEVVRMLSFFDLCKNVLSAKRHDKQPQFIINMLGRYLILLELLMTQTDGTLAKLHSYSCDEASIAVTPLILNHLYN